MGSARTPMKAGMMTADAVTNVSPTYAGQLLDPAYALRARERGAPVRGEAPGRAQRHRRRDDRPRARRRESPRTSARTISRGRPAWARAALQRDAVLEVCADAPVVSIVSRLVGPQGYRPCGAGTRRDRRVRLPAACARDRGRRTTKTPSARRGALAGARERADHLFRRLARRGLRGQATCCSCPRAASRAACRR